MTQYVVVFTFSEKEYVKVCVESCEDLSPYLQRIEMDYDGVEIVFICKSSHISMELLQKFLLKFSRQDKNIYHIAEKDRKFLKDNISMIFKKPQSIKKLHSKIVTFWLKEVEECNFSDSKLVLKSAIFDKFSQTNTKMTNSQFWKESYAILPLEEVRKQVNNIRKYYVYFNDIKKAINILKSFDISQFDQH